MGLLDLTGPVLSIIDKIIPDPAAKAAAQLEVMKLQQSGELAEMTADVQLSTAQTDINKVEASNASLFVSGWRPAVGWVGSISLFLAYVPKEIVLTVFWGISAYHSVTNGSALPPFPDMGITDLLGLLGSLLGFGYLRHKEKLADVSQNG